MHIDIPQLSETWGAAYIQIIIALFIFLIGLPVIILQIGITEEIRGIYLRYQKKRWINITLSITFFSALLLIWTIHPCPRIISPDIKSIIIAILITFLLINVILMYLTLFKEGKKALVNSIFKKCCFYSKNPKYFINKSINPFEDLTFIGESGKPGSEKFIVITKFKKLTKIIIDRNDFDYYIFDDVINSLKKIVLNGFYLGNETNFISVLEVLISIREYFITNLHESEYSIKNIDKIIGEICIECLKLNYKEAAILYQQIIKGDSNQLFKVGKNAIQQNAYSISITCINDLENILEQKRKNTGKLVKNDFIQLLGLAAHIWSINNSSKIRINTMFEIYSKSFIPSIKTCLKVAICEYTSTHDFITADKIEELMNDKFPEKLKRRA